MPAPLHMPSTRTSPPESRTLLATSLGKVSVVIMALATSMAVAWPRDPESFSAAGFQRSILSCAPMTPVLAGSTSEGSTRAAWAIISWVARQLARPSSPVQALAWPELTRMARATGLSARMSLHTSTGAAWKRLVVNTPAATAGPSLTMRPRSLRSAFLKPAAATANRYPLGTMVMGAPRKDSSRPVGTTREKR